MNWLLQPYLADRPLVCEARHASERHCGLEQWITLNLHLIIYRLYLSHLRLPFRARASLLNADIRSKKKEKKTLDSDVTSIPPCCRPLLSI